MDGTHVSVPKSGDEKQEGSELLFTSPTGAPYIFHIHGCPSDSQRIKEQITHCGGIIIEDIEPFMSDVEAIGSDEEEKKSIRQFDDDENLNPPIILIPNEDAFIPRFQSFEVYLLQLIIDSIKENSLPNFSDYIVNAPPPTPRRRSSSRRSRPSSLSSPDIQTASKEGEKACSTSSPLRSPHSSASASGPSKPHRKAISSSTSPFKKVSDESLDSELVSNIQPAFQEKKKISLKSKAAEHIGEPALLEKQEEPMNVDLAEEDKANDGVSSVPSDAATLDILSLRELSESDADSEDLSPSQRALQHPKNSMDSSQNRFSKADVTGKTLDKTVPDLDDTDSDASTCDDIKSSPLKKSYREPCPTRAVSNSPRCSENICKASMNSKAAPISQLYRRFFAQRNSTPDDREIVDALRETQPLPSTASPVKQPPKTANRTPVKRISLRPPSRLTELWPLRSGKEDHARSKEEKRPDLAKADAMKPSDEREAPRPKDQSKEIGSDDESESNIAVSSTSSKAQKAVKHSRLFSSDSDSEEDDRPYAPLRPSQRAKVPPRSGGITTSELKKGSHLEVPASSRFIDRGMSSDAVSKSPQSKISRQQGPSPKKLAAQQGKYVASTKVPPRTPYSHDEDQGMLDYVIQNSAYADVKGRRFWQEAEQIGICPGRTWQSMKERFLKHIMKSLDSYELTRDQKARLENVGKHSGGKYGPSHDQVSIASSTSSLAFYTTEEDVRIIEEVLATHQWDKVCGNAIWKEIEHKFRNRSWQGLKERYLKRIIPNLDGYPIRKEDAEKLLYPGLVSEPKRKRLLEVIANSKRSKNLSEYIIGSKRPKITNEKDHQLPKPTEIRVRQGSAVQPPAKKFNI